MTKITEALKPFLPILSLLLVIILGGFFLLGFEKIKSIINEQGGPKISTAVYSADEVFSYEPYGNMSTSSYKDFVQSKHTPNFIKAFTRPLIEEFEILKIKTLRTRSQDFYDYSANYPVFANIENKSQQELLNKAVETSARDFISNYFKNTSPDPDDYDLGWEARRNYIDSYFNYRLTSITFKFYHYKGGVHGFGFTDPFNYDFSLKKEIVLNDIFNEESDYLNWLSVNSYKKLMNKFDYDKEWAKRGTEPNEENFNLFRFEKSGITFYFQPYQVESYAAGEQEVFFSYNELNSILKKEYNFKDLDDSEY